MAKEGGAGRQAGVGCADHDQEVSAVPSRRPQRTRLLQYAAISWPLQGVGGWVGEVGEVCSPPAATAKLCAPSEATRPSLEEVRKDLCFSCPAQIHPSQ